MTTQLAFSAFCKGWRSKACPSTSFAGGRVLASLRLGPFGVGSLQEREPAFQFCLAAVVPTVCTAAPITLPWPGSCTNAISRRLRVSIPESSFN